MVQHIQDKKTGKMAGSIGDGKNKVPSAAPKIPAQFPKTPELTEVETIALGLPRPNPYYLSKVEAGQILDVAIGAVQKHPKSATLQDILQAENIDAERMSSSYNNMLANTISEIKEKYIDIAAVEADPRNLLNPDLPKSYEQVLAFDLAAHGDPVGLDDSIYGWVDYDALTHMRTCSIASIYNTKTDYWNEFVDTFADSEEGNKVGVIGSMVCSCGTVQRRIRHEVDYMELVRTF